MAKTAGKSGLPQDPEVERIDAILDKDDEERKRHARRQLTFEEEEPPAGSGSKRRAESDPEYIPPKGTPKRRRTPGKRGTGSAQKRKQVNESICHV